MDKKERNRCCEFPGVRYFFAVNGLLGFCVVYALRFNLNVAIVAMVNNTAVYQDQNDSLSAECQINPNNQSEPDQPDADGEFIWSPELQGIILGAFYYGYCATQIPGGRLAEIYSGKWVFGIGSLVTIFLTMLTPLAARYHVGWLITIRILEGAAQGVMWPSMNFMLGRWLPDSEKTVLNTVVHSGIKLGALITMPLVGRLCSSDWFGGWPAAFYVLGIGGSIWFVSWVFFITDSPLNHPFISQKELEYITSNQKIVQTKELPPFPWRRILMSVPFWAVVIVRMCEDWNFYIYMTDMPTYLARIQNFNIEQSGFLSAFPHLLQLLVAWPVSFVADAMIRKKLASLNFVRKFCYSVSGVTSSICLIGICLSGCNVHLNIFFFMFTVAVQGFCYSGYILTFLDLSPEYAGSLIGISNTISNLTGFITPAVVGALTNEHQTMHQWQYVFGMSSGLQIFSTMVFLFFASHDKQDWAEQVELLSEPQNSENRKKYGLLN